MALAHSLAAQVVPVGSEFQVNVDTTSYPTLPSLAARDGGDFVVVWARNGPLRGRRYAPDGTAVGGEFQVNSFTTGGQTRPRVAMDATGSFVVVWSSWGSPGNDTSDRSIQGQLFAPDGSALGGQFQVNSHTTAEQMYPSVSMDADGDFVVVWMNWRPGPVGWLGDVSAQRFASNGLRLGNEFQVDTSATGKAGRPSVALAPDGDFVVTWQDGSGPAGSIQAQRFAGDGTPLGGQIQVNAYATFAQTFPSVALDADGNFVIAWSSGGSGGTDTSGFSTQGRLFAADGTPIGSQFQVNTYTTGDQGGFSSFRDAPSVSRAATGEFVIVWSSAGSSGTDTDFWSAQGQLFAADGTRLGGEFQLNSFTTGHQDTPSAALGADGRLVAVWKSSANAAPVFQNIQGQRYVLAIFDDGFETGDVRAWSASVP